MSSTYQEQVNLATDKYNADHKKISREDVELFIKWKKDKLRSFLKIMKMH